MSRTRATTGAWGLTAGLTLLLSACTNEFVVLEPFGTGSDDDDAGGLAADAGIPGTTDAGTRRDGGSAPDGDADPVDGAAVRDGGPGGEADSSDFPADAARDGGRVASAARQVSAFAHTCAVDAHALYCWGDGNDQQFGEAGGLPKATPVLLAEGDFVDVCAAEQHACALRADGVLLCWGGNDAGQLGVGDRQPRAQPSEVVRGGFSSVACGGHITCALTGAGELYCWGSNREGTLGQGDDGSADSADPVRVAPDLTVRQVSVGQGHVCAVDQSGALYCWGRNTLGQLGAEPSLIQVRTPVRVDSQLSFARVAAAQNHTCAISQDSRPYCWGDNRNPLLGVRDDRPRLDAPAPVDIEGAYAQVAASWFHSCLIEQSGSLYCWGRNTEGQLGVGDTMARTTPTRVGLDSDWQAITVGRFHTCGVRADGLYCWGENHDGQLGLGDFARQPLPAPVSLR